MWKDKEGHPTLENQDPPTKNRAFGKDREPGSGETHLPILALCADETVHLSDVEQVRWRRILETAGVWAQWGSSFGLCVCYQTQAPLTAHSEDRMPETGLHSSTMAVIKYPMKQKRVFSHFRKLAVQIRCEQG